MFINTLVGGGGKYRGDQQIVSTYKGGSKKLHPVKRGDQKNVHALRAFTNTIFYCFTLFSAHSLPSLQILRRTLRQFEQFLHWGGGSKKCKTLKRGDQKYFEVHSPNFSNPHPFKVFMNTPLATSLYFIISLYYQHQKQMYRYH